jgi:transposase
MGKIRKQHSSKTKLEAAIAMISGKYPVAELCQKYGVHQSVLQRWRNELSEKGTDIFSRRKKSKEEGSSPEDLQRKIGQLTMELDFLKKALGK